MNDSIKGQVLKLSKGKANPALAGKFWSGS